MKVKDIFNIMSGSKLDFDKQVVDSNGINFVSRNSNYNGIVGRIIPPDDTTIFKKGDISVSLGGSYLLSCFIQEEPFVTGQNVAVLRPKNSMSKVEKLFYCYALSLNRFRFCAFGREVNKYLKDIELPDKIPSFVNNTNLNPFQTNNSVKFDNVDTSLWKTFRLDMIFTKKKIKKFSKTPETIGNIPFVTSQSLNNGVKCYVDEEPLDGNCITISTNGSGFDPFYHTKPIVVSNDVEVLYSNNLDIYIGIFLVTILRLEKFRWVYGRKPKNNKVFETKIKLPEREGKPDWEYMREFVKKLSYGDVI